MIQPDLFVICGDHEAPGAVRFEGAPDLVVEIVSPSSVKRDKYTKLHKYADAGVREYWIVDPKRRKVTVYLLEKDSDPEVYSFRDTIPIGLSEGTCGIDFSLIEKRVERYL
jgi:Uma2 family endonuclease